MSNTFKRVQLDRKQRGLDGFTLIELLIVIVVLGVLAAIVVFALGGVSGSSAVSACSSDANAVSTAVSAEQTQTPNALPNLEVGSAPGDLVPTYLKSMPANSNLYAISLSPDSLAVEVTLEGNDPGTAYADASGPQLFEADNVNGTVNQAFLYASTDGTLANQGICAGA